MNAANVAVRYSDGAAGCRHLYATTPDDNFAQYVQNTRDGAHFDNYYAPFAEASLGGFDSSGQIESIQKRLWAGRQPGTTPVPGGLNESGRRYGEGCAGP
jgi:hypothetical protein